MILTLLAVGLVFFVAIAVVGKIFTMMLTIGVFVILSGIIAGITQKIGKKQTWIVIIIGALIAAGSFLLLL